MKFTPRKCLVAVVLMLGLASLIGTNNKGQKAQTSLAVPTVAQTAAHTNQNNTNAINVRVQISPTIRK